MTQEIIEAVREIEREKGIESGTLVNALEDALLAAYKKIPDASRHATVELDVAAARAVPGVHAVLSAADENVRQGRRPLFQSEPAYAGAPVAALANRPAINIERIEHSPRPP